MFDHFFHSFDDYVILLISKRICDTILFMYFEIWVKNNETLFYDRYTWLIFSQQ